MILVSGSEHQDESKDEVDGGRWDWVGLVLDEVAVAVVRRTTPDLDVLKLFKLLNQTSAPIEAWKCNFPSF